MHEDEAPDFFVADLNTSSLSHNKIEAPRDPSETSKSRNLEQIEISTSNSVQQFPSQAIQSQVKAQIEVKSEISSGRVEHESAYKTE